LDERVRPSHQKMHGQKTGINSAWSLPGGAKLMFPGDSSGPAGEVINCRCLETVDMTSYSPPASGGE
jgi:uncharacterized protein with gpF-like domain